MISLYMNVTYKCNSKCIFCAADQLFNLRGLTLEEIKDIMKKASIKQGDRVIINGGEPTLHPDILEIVEYINKCGAYIVLFSNGIKLSNKEFAKELFERGVGKFTVPFYSHQPEVHNFLTQQDSFLDVDRAILNLMELRSKYDFVLELKTLVMKPNHSHLKKILKRVKEQYYCDRFYINGLILSDQVKSSGVELNLIEAKESLHEGVNYALESKIPFLMDSIPLCIFEKSTLIKYMFHRKQLITGEGYYEFVYYNNQTGELTPDSFNDCSTKCFYEECSLKRICRLNPKNFNAENKPIIKPVILKGLP